MSPFEISQILIGIGVITFTYFLYQATYRLNETTKVLADHTKSLVEHEEEQRRTQDLKRCIYLVELIIHPEPDDIDYSELGEFSSKYLHLFNELLALGQYFHADSDAKKQLEDMSFRFETAVKIGEPSIKVKNVREDVNKLYAQLVNEMISWQKDLGNYGRR